MATTKKKSFDAVAASRRWRIQAGRKLRGLNFEQQQELLRRATDAFFAETPARTAEAGRGLTHSRRQTRPGGSSSVFGDGDAPPSARGSDCGTAFARRLGKIFLPTKFSDPTLRPFFFG